MALAVPLPVATVFAAASSQPRSPSSAGFDYTWRTCKVPARSAAGAHPQRKSSFVVQAAQSVECVEGLQKEMVGKAAATDAQFDDVERLAGSIALSLQIAPEDRVPPRHRPAP
jgi:hypothetical protein